jgi:tetratricopeptide (TPR) repeat protein
VGGEDGEAGDAEAPTEEDAEDLQIAWENLEAARTIYEASGSDQLELARVHLRLGDVSNLNENFEGSIADFEKCLAIREELCEPHSKLLSEVHSALWETHGLASDKSEKDHSVPYLHHLKKSLGCMEACLARTQSDLKGVEAGMEDEEGRTKEQLEKVIQDLTETIPEIKEVIAAAQEAPESAQALKDHLKDTNAEQASAPVTTTGLGGFAMPTEAAAKAEVKTLVPRKRKAPAAGGEGAKAPKTEDKTAALAARMGGAAPSGSFSFGGGSTTIGF